MSASAASTSSAESASIGRTGCRICTAIASNAARPPVSAARAADGRSPAINTARRTFAAGMSRRGDRVEDDALERALTQLTIQKASQEVLLRRGRSRKERAQLLRALCAEPGRRPRPSLRRRDRSPQSRGKHRRPPVRPRLPPPRHSPRQAGLAWSDLKGRRRRERSRRRRAGGAGPPVVPPCRGDRTLLVRRRTFRQDR